MLVLIFIFLYIFLITIGIGNIVSKLVIKNNTEIPLDLLSLLGFISLSAILNVLHLFIPLGGMGIHLAFIVLVIFFNKNKIGSLNKNSFLKLKKHLNPLVILTFILTLIVASSEALMYDTKLYHAQVLLWYEQYSVVPGLGNLHTRLAFQSFLFSTSTFFDFSFFNKQLIYPVNGYFNLLILIRLIIEIRADFSHKRYGYILFEWFFVITNIYLGLIITISSPSPDYLASMLLFYIFIILKLKILGNESLDLLILVSVFMPFIKLGQFFFVFLPLFFIYQKRQYKVYFYSVSILGIPYLLHNYIQTGYLLYPTSYFNYFNPDWKLPIENVENIKNWILSWARIPNEPYNKVLSMSFIEWFPKWFLNKSIFQKTLLIMVALSPFISLIFSRRKRLNVEWLYLGIICSISILFWLLTAPDLRFGLGFLSIMAFFPFLGFDIKALDIFHKFTFLSVVLTLSLIFAHYPVLKLNRFDKLNFLFPPKMSILDTKEKECFNFKVKIPVLKDQCGCESLPCAPGYSTKLAKRDSSFAKGFRIRL
jgi:hypothetical protein